MKFCPNCNSEYEDKFAFCNKCGSKLQEKIEESFCPYCGNKIETDGEFCPYCGNPLEESISPTVAIQSQKNTKDNVLPVVNFKKNYVKMAPLQRSEDAVIYNNGFFGFSGRMEKAAFAKKMIFAEVFALFSCYISLLSYWRRLMIVNSVWMATLLILSTVLILGMAKRRQNDTSLSDAFFNYSVLGILAIQVVAKFKDLKMSHDLCTFLIFASVGVSGYFLGSLFYTKKKENITEIGNSGEMNLLIWINLLLLIPIFYFFYKNNIVVPYDI